MTTSAKRDIWGYSATGAFNWQRKTSCQAVRPQSCHIHVAVHLSNQSRCPRDNQWSGSADSPRSLHWNSQPRKRRLLPPWPCLSPSVAVLPREKDKHAQMLFSKQGFVGIYWYRYLSYFACSWYRYALPYVSRFLARQIWRKIKKQKGSLGTISIAGTRNDFLLRFHLVRLDPCFRHK